MLRLSRQVERRWPAGGAAVSPGGAGVPAQPDGGHAQPHGPPGQSYGAPPRARQAAALSLPATAAAARLWVHTEPASSLLLNTSHVRATFHASHLFAGLSSREARPAGKAPNVSLNWSWGDGSPEEVSTTTGRRRDSGTPSRLCRRLMFGRWLRLQQVGWRPSLCPC